MPKDGHQQIGMLFNDTINKYGAIQECENWLFGGQYGAISDNPNLLKTFTNLINYGVIQTLGLIITSDGKWQHGDSNNTELPIATTTMTDGVSTYRLPDDTLKIRGFEVKDFDGNWFPIYQVDYEKIRASGIAIDEYFETKGMPLQYDLTGDTVRLFPAPATDYVTMANGLKIVYQDDFYKFTSTDTTKEMGFPSLCEDMPILFACNKFAKQNSLSDKARELDGEINKRSQEIKKHFSTRNVDKRLAFKPHYKSSR